MLTQAETVEALLWQQRLTLEPFFGHAAIHHGDGVHHPSHPEEPQAQHALLRPYSTLEPTEKIRKSKIQ